MRITYWCYNTTHIEFNVEEMDLLIKKGMQGQKVSPKEVFENLVKQLFDDLEQQVNQ